MICLGIESTAHTFGIGIFDGKKILANEKSSYFSKTGGIVPAEAAEHHRKVAEKLCSAALKKANLELGDINTVAFAAGPGLPPCLLAGMEFAKSLGNPIVPVSHCVAHIEIGKWATGCKDPLIVYVSGGNTQIIGYEAKRYRVYGETLDIGLGNALDKFARNLGLPAPGGVYVEKLAAKGKKYIELPYTVKGMDITYSGLVTAASRLTKTEKTGGKLIRDKEKYIHSENRGSQPTHEYSKEDLCYSFQETAFSMLVEVAERALAHTKKKEILLTGGVAQNKRLQEMLAEMGKPHGAKFFVPKPEWCGDNGAMVAIAGWLNGKTPKSIDISPRWRTDDVEINWM